MSEQKDITRKFFDDIAEEYYSRYLTMDSAKECLDIILKMLATVMPEEGELLDLGCGPGYLADLLADRYTIVAVDISRKMITFARDNSKNLVWYFEDDVETFDTKKEEFNGFFDVAIAKGLFEYLEEDEDLLENVHRMLNPGGHLIAEFRHAGFTHGDPDYVDPYPMKRRVHDPMWVGKLAEDLGFETVDVVFYHYHKGLDVPEAASAFVVLFKKMS